MTKDKMISSVLTNYIKLVEKTSKIEIINKEIGYSDGPKHLAAFWHGYSYCLYPTIIGLDVAVVTTINKRGDYIADMCENFGYLPLRVPDESSSGNPLFKLAREINSNKDKHLAVATDGPLGPYHIPKDFTFVLAEMTNRSIMPVTVDAKRCITLFKRWDKFKVPLPFNKIVVKFHEPIKLNKADRTDGYNLVRAKLTVELEEQIIF